MKFPKNNIKKLKGSIAIAQKVDTILSDAIKGNKPQANTSGMASDNSFLKTFLNYLLFFTYLGLSFFIVVVNLDGIAFFYKNLPAVLVFKALLSVIVFIVYIKSRSLLMDFLFPKVNKEIIKTVYKLSPEMLIEEDDFDIKVNKNSVTNYVILFVFTIVISSLLFAQPTILNFVFGIFVESSLTSFMIRLILLTFGLGIYLSVRNLILIHREYDHLNEMLWKVKKFSHKRKGLDILTYSMPENRTSIVAEKLKAISRIVGIKGFVSSEDLRDHSFSHNNLAQSFSLYIVAIMPVLGLIGTILGLTIAIGGLEGVIGSALTNQQDFAEGLGTSVKGIGTAFYTTLAGTVCMLVLRFFNLITTNVQINFMVDLRNIIAVEIIPLFGADYFLKNK